MGWCVPDVEWRHGLHSTSGLTDWLHYEDDPTVKTSEPKHLGFLVPRIDLHHLLMRLFDRFLGLPILHQHALDHVAKRIGAEHLACGSIHGTGKGELPPTL